MNATDTIRRVILPEMLTLYQPPRQVTNERQAAIFQEAILTAVAQFNPTEAEIRDVWEKFKLTWKRTFWPGPAELCQAIIDYRDRAALADKAVRSRRPRPIDHSMTEADERRFEATVAHLRRHPEQYLYGGALLRMADYFESDEYRRRQDRAAADMAAWERENA